ncbi:MAG: hypothetical protein EOO90_06245 [Pedobacter sp.]|nr:MAG: hypothetical protein EOO90_06245 [Pedobacter sp.]
MITAAEISREHDLTIEEVKSLPMFAHFSDEQAREVIITIKRFSEIIFKCHERNGNSPSETSGSSP